MAKDLSTATRIGTDADFVNGDLVDETIGTQGTLLDTTVLQDVIQFFQKVLAKAGITANGAFDNEANGYQLLQAVDQRNDTNTARMFSINSSVTLAQNQTETIYYPYGAVISTARFMGLNTLDSTASSIDGTVSSFPAQGQILSSFGGFTLLAFTDRLEISNTDPVVSKVNTSIQVFGHVNF